MSVSYPAVAVVENDDPVSRTESDDSVYNINYFGGSQYTTGYIYEQHPPVSQS